MTKDPEIAALLEIPDFLRAGRLADTARDRTGTVQPECAKDKRPRPPRARKRKRGPRWKSKATIRKLEALGWSPYRIRKFTTEEAAKVVELRLKDSTPKWKDPEE